MEEASLAATLCRPTCRTPATLESCEVEVLPQPSGVGTADRGSPRHGNCVRHRLDCRLESLFLRRRSTVTEQRESEGG